MVSENVIKSITEGNIVRALTNDITLIP